MTTIASIAVLPYPVFASSDVALALAGFLKPSQVTFPNRGWLHFVLQRGSGPSSAVVGASTMTAGPWILPTTMADGSAIGTITGQTVYYDTVSRMGTGVAYAYSQSVGDGVSLTKILTGLAALTIYYYAVTVIVNGVESDYGMESSGVSS